MTQNKSFETALNQQRQQLVDIGKRNPLTNTPLNKKSSRYLEITDELSDQVFKRLHTDGKRFTFLPRAQTAGGDTTYKIEETVNIPQSLSDALHQRHTDSKLQTEQTLEVLQKRLLSLYRENRRIEEEQGISVLNLALGFLEYYDSKSSLVARFAPLILLPVTLNRSNARSQFSLERRDDEIEHNHSIEYLLSSDYSIKLPHFQDDGSESLLAYFQRVRALLSFEERWRVHDHQIALGFFSFGKYRMYRDLELQPSLKGGLVEKLLVGNDNNQEGSSSSPISITQEPLDQKYQNPKDLGHILDADTSQTEVIAKVAKELNLVVQGPPGTGKSQTIANIIAVMARAGKNILFISEKKAALEVVFRRLYLAGLGPLCLELHSQKSTRKVFYEEIRKTMELNEPFDVSQDKYDETRRVRDELNELSTLLHTVDEQTGNTPFLLMGRISKLLGLNVPLVNFEIDGIDQWSADEFSKKLNTVSKLAEQTSKVGNEGSHVWQGVSRRMNAADQVRLKSMLENIKTLVASTIDTVTQEVDWRTDSEVITLAECHVLAQLLNMATEYSDYWDSLLSHSEISSYSSVLCELCSNITSSQKMRETLKEKVVQSAFNESWEIVLRDLSLNEKAMFRMFNGAYKRAKRQLLSVAKLPVKKIGAQIDLAKQLMSHESLVAEINEQREIGRTFFGLSWQKEETDVAKTIQALEWLNRVISVVGTIDLALSFVNHIKSLGNSSELYRRLSKHRDELTHSLNELAKFAKVEWETVSGTDSLDTYSLTSLSKRINLWLQNVDKLDEYSILRMLAEEVDNQGLPAIRSQLASGELDPTKAKDAFRLARAELVFNRLVKADPRLLQIDGADRTRKVKRFAELDQELLELASQELARKHYINIPRGQTGQLGLLRGEMNKKSRHMSIRNLLVKAGDAILQIKPVFMMSPLSVAQYLKPGVLQFDLLLIDEASQVKPAEALGAIMRCKQVVVVGDQKQMPPTSFFDRQMAADEEDEEKVEVDMGGQAAHMESILSLCDARTAMDRSMLSWHYRSEHPSLIEVSNHEFYENKLTYPPSPFAGSKHSGLSIVQSHGEYQRGRSRNNPIEGDKICEYVLKHVREFPNLSLGVVALSVAQRDLIDNKMELLRANNTEVDAFCADSKEEPFFVKNLENVQGDERDVIYISIGYGKDSDGYFAQNFGPVSSEGGERRLNVLFTRARKKCTVFASISHDDIRTDVSTHAGPRVLKSFLKFAETGDMDVPRLTGEEFDSPFEEDVANVILSFGYHVEGQVGTSGFKIDLVVCDSEDSSRYLLAVECDGARYHSSAWARERDRLRQQVLEGKGWKFHRIWSTDWFYNREIETQKLLAAIEVAKSTQTNGNESGELNPNTPPRTVEIQRNESNDEKPKATSMEVQPYVEVKLKVSHLSHESLVEFSYKLTELIKKIVDVESPVHEQVVVKKIAAVWGVKRIGSRIQEAIDRSIQNAVSKNLVQKLQTEPSFLISRDRVFVRDRTNAASFIRQIEHISLVELKLGITRIIKDGISVSTTECVNYLCRVLGFGRTTDSIQSRIQLAIDQLVKSGTVTVDKGTLRLD